jgi:pectate lyase
MNINPLTKQLAVLACGGLVVLSANAQPTRSNIVSDFSLIGFATVAGGTTGGAGGGTGSVSTVSELIAAVGSPVASNIIISGTFDLGSNTLKLASHKTIIGAGSNAGFIGHVYLHGVSNVIFRNLNFANPQGVGQGIGRGDGLTTHSSYHVWVDHCNFGECADGQFDITHGSDLLTVSWCRFFYTNAANEHRLSMLIGNKDNLAAEDAGRLHVTLHHNWIGELVQDRSPRVRFGQVHVFNNYYGAKDINTCIGLGCGSQVLAESCDFDGMKRPWRSRSEPNCTEGRIQWNDDHIYNHPKLTIEGTNSTVFKPAYAYKLDAGKEVKDNVLKNAGAGKGPFAPK